MLMMVETCGDTQLLSGRGTSRFSTATGWSEQPSRPARNAGWVAEAGNHASVGSSKPACLVGCRGTLGEPASPLATTTAAVA